MGIEQSTDKKRVAIFTNFFSYDPAYSLIRVTEDQVKMFLQNGYSPVVIVSESFDPKGTVFEKVELRKVPNVPCHNEVKKDENFDKDVDSIYQALKDHLKDIDICLTQDIVYKPSELKYNFAARKLASEYENIKWLHWINSATPPITLNNLMGIFQDEYLELVKKKFPNSKYIFFNEISREIVARNFNVPLDDVRVVHHPSDLHEVYGVTSDHLKSFIDKRDVYSADAITVYPVRLDRGKQAEFVVKTSAMIKELDMSVRCIIVDFHSTGGDKVVYRDQLKQLGLDWGLTPQELSFTSEFSDEWQARIPHEDVMALFRMSNFFVMPSVSESYSLITQEAALTKNIVILNQDFPPFREIFGPKNIFRKYSSNWDILAGYDEAMGEGKNTRTSYGPANISDGERLPYEKAYHKATAAQVVDMLKNDPGFATNRFIRKNRNLNAVFKQELEPLLYL
jgi:glycosyltransferase involved in cell wall biosynthesis